MSFSPSSCRYLRIINHHFEPVRFARRAVTLIAPTRRLSMHSLQGDLLSAEVRTGGFRNEVESTGRSGGKHKNVASTIGITKAM